MYGVWLRLSDLMRKDRFRYDPGVDGEMIFRGPWLCLAGQGSAAEGSWQKMSVVLFHTQIKDVLS